MDLSRVFFGMMYRVGFTPWEGHPVPTRFGELVVGPNKLPAARALDVGCGTGDASVLLAKRGWDVTGVDFVEKALGRARAKAGAAGVRVRFVRGDVTRLRESGVEGPFTLLIDNGCFHGLSDDGRDAYVREISAVSAPGAHLVIMAFPTGRRAPGPRGVDLREIERRFASGWHLLANGPEPTVSTTTARWRDIRFYELRRDDAQA
jgi:SAM-dependent methyltransferase